jgi:(p)ppGpp synthase/HD superfamily hydrolase
MTDEPKILKSNLSLAIAIATEAHDGQVDRGGAPYILHPLRVMLSVQGDRERIAAVLHDVAEDCPAWPLDRLRAQPFSGAVCDALDALTRRPGEEYGVFIARCAADPIARVVKLADLKDNCDLSRIKRPTDKDAERVRKYVNASMVLLSAIQTAA